MLQLVFVHFILGIICFRSGKWLIQKIEIEAVNFVDMYIEFRNASLNAILPIVHFYLSAERCFFQG